VRVPRSLADSSARSRVPLRGCIRRALRPELGASSSTGQSTLSLSLSRCSLRDLKAHGEFPFQARAIKFRSVVGLHGLPASHPPPPTHPPLSARLIAIYSFIHANETPGFAQTRNPPGRAITVARGNARRASEERATTKRGGGRGRRGEVYLGNASR